MEYACTVWDPMTQNHIKEIEMVQRRAARFGVGDFRTTVSVSKMLESLEWQTMEQRRKQAKLCVL